MSLLEQFETSQIQTMIRASNYWSTYNRNDYPVQLETAINTLYTWIECPCSDDCMCKSFGCTHHLARINEADFDSHFEHFLNCYVDAHAHEAIRRGRANGRGKNAVSATDIFRSRWADIQADNQALRTPSLICDSWNTGLLALIAESFRPSGDKIYEAKWLSFLNMGIYVAFDNGSVRLLNRDFNSPSTYLGLMTNLREALISHLRSNQITIDTFLTLDRPSEFYPRIQEPSRRPLGNILDKLYLVL